VTEQLRLEPADPGDLFPHLTDAEFERVVAALSPPTVGVLAGLCHCEGGPLVDSTDDLLGPTCVKCGRWVR
jgi:hypothetical protein